MSTEMTGSRPPRGLSRMLYRLPIWLYRLRLGRLLGERFLLLNHIGRKSGLSRQAVLEVIRHDRVSDTYFVASGWGEKADWFRNIQKTPEVVIDVGRRHLGAVAERLRQEQTERELLDYAQRHPTAFRALARLIGYRVTDSEEDVRALARQIPILALRSALPAKEVDDNGD
ncbi:MAG: nitroreductase family deazaflavin-dependent oxidoreductase [Anaerolineae bacterium]